MPLPTFEITQTTKDSLFQVFIFLIYYF